jgi:hypothetical protein
MKCLPISGKKLNIILVCVMPLTVFIFRSNENIRNFVRSHVCNVQILPFKAKHPLLHLGLILLGYNQLFIFRPSAIITV